jgi:transcription termination/antitermination protein NusG
MAAARPELERTMQLSGQSWYAVRVKYRMENGVNVILQEKGYEGFLPIYRVRKNWSDRTKSLDLPLFPGYVFCRMGESACGMIITTPGVIQVVAFGKRPYSIPDSEIESIKRIGLFADPRPTTYCAIGQRVRIKEGPLTGVTGILKEMKNGRRFIVSLESIAKSISIEVDESVVCAVDESVVCAVNDNGTQCDGPS